MTTAYQIVTFILITLFPGDLKNISDYRPMDHLYGKVQYAGNLGLASAGIGTFFFHDKISVDLSYGYLPRFVNGADVNTLALKSAFQLAKTGGETFRINLYSGVTLTYSITNNTYIDYPDHFPEGYYMSNAFHFNPFFGMRFYPSGKGKSNSLAIYSELGTVDYKIWNSLANKRISPFEIWNVCFGIIFPLK